jgi:CIC family chloride channel protein
MRFPKVSLEAPRPLRTIVRQTETSLAALGALVGAVARRGGRHGCKRRLPPQRALWSGSLTAQTSLDPLQAVAVPLVGGLFCGLACAWIVRRRGCREVDPIEAQCLHGERMSFSGSLTVAAQRRSTRQFLGDPR